MRHCVIVYANEEELASADFDNFEQAFYYAESWRARGYRVKQFRSLG